MRWNRRKVVAGATAVMTLMAAAAAIAAGGSDETSPPAEQHGTLGAEATTAGDSLGGTKVYNVDPASLTAGGEAQTWSKLAGGNCLRANGVFYAPLEIPHDSEVVAAIADIRDDTGSAQVEIDIRRRTPGTPSTEDLFTGATGSTETPGRTTLGLDNQGGDNTLNKNVETFFVFVRMLEESSNLEFCNLRVLYDPPAGGEEFHPVTPCAIFDTRPGHGGIERKLANGEQISVDTNRSDSSSQGGAAEDCGIPNATGSSLFGDSEFQASAVAVNLVALEPDGSGNLRAWEEGASAPAGGVLVYNEGERNGNELAINIASGSAFGGDGGQITIENNGPDTHVRAVVVGYYTPVDSRW